MSKQRSWLNSLLIDMNNKCDKFLSSFSLFNKEFSLGNRLINSFSNHFSFYSQIQDIKENLCKLNNITIQASFNSYSSIVIFDASIKNYIATSILYIHSYDSSVIKICYYAVNVSTTEAKLFTIRCGINQAVGISNINCIVIITDLLHATKRIFDSLLYSYQIHSAAISRELREFFRKNINNHIEFWDCSSKWNWSLHFLVDKDTKSFKLSSSFLYKSSWDFCKKHDCNSILS